MSFKSFLFKNINVNVNDDAFDGKIDPTQYDKDTNTIIVKSDYDIKNDPEGWMQHEKMHHLLNLKNVKDDGKIYPKNNIEKFAYISQFKLLKKRGHSLKDITNIKKFPTLATKFSKYNGEYAPTLIEYWKLAK